MGERVDRADGPRADDGRGAAVPLRRDLARRSTCRRRRPSRRSRTSTSRAGSSASRRSRSTATTARSASRCPTPRRRPRRADGQAVEKVVEYRPTRKRLPKKRPAQMTSFAVGGAEGYMTAVVLPRRRPRRDLPQDVEAGLDPGRRHGRVLDRDLDRPAVRRPAGDVRLEVRQHALRAGRPDRRPGRPDGAVDHGLHLPPAGAGLPRLRHPLRLRHLLRRGAVPSARDRVLPGRRVATRTSRRSSRRWRSPRR